MFPIKLVVVGDANIGKTCFIKTIIDGIFPEEKINEIHQVNANGDKQIEKGKTTYNLRFWDTFTDPDYVILRKLIYPNTNVFILSFSLVNRNSIDYLKTNIIPEIESYPHSCFILVGFQSDKRNEIISKKSVSSSDDYITTEEGLQLAHELNIRNYFEVSSKEQKNLMKVVHSCIELVNNKRHYKKPPICVVV